MNIASATFECSAPDLDSCPDESLPEFAFIGRSNVGKSSLLNLLAGEQGLARVSPTPGFTQLINLFTINQGWRLVGLPGYGFAQGARQERARFSHAVSTYLEHRPNLCLVFVLLEAALAPQALDLAAVEWLARRAVPFVLVFTKMDQVSAATAQANIAAFTERIAVWFEKLPAVFTCSAAARQGRQALLGVIEEQMTAINAASLPAPAPAERSARLSLQERVRENRKRRPDRHRPW